MQSFKPVKETYLQKVNENDQVNYMIQHRKEQQTIGVYYTPG